MEIPANLVSMGYITGAFGIKGWVKIKVSTRSADSLSGYADIYLQLKDGKLILGKIESGFVRDGIFHAKLAGIDDKEAAMLLKGATLAVARDQFPQPEEGEYYWVDLIGLEVHNLNGDYLGCVTELMETGANDVLVVTDAGNKRLIPFVMAYVTKVDLQNKQIIVDWGLDY